MNITQVCGGLLLFFVQAGAALNAATEHIPVVVVKIVLLDIEHTVHASANPQLLKATQREYIQRGRRTLPAAALSQFKRASCKHGTLARAILS